MNLQIWFGSGPNNIYSSIWSRGEFQVTAKTPSLLSDKVYREFWVKWEDGTIHVGKEGVERPLMSYTKQFNNGYGYFAVRNESDSQAHWYFEGNTRSLNGVQYLT